MPSPDTQDQTLWGPINAQRKKADLDAIAQALDIFRPKSKDNRTVLARKINQHLKKNPALAKEKRFQGLYSYRRDKEAERGAPKSSAEKEAEVELEASKTAKEATGALKTLVDQDIARDPPARTARLNGRFTRSSGPPKTTVQESSEVEESSPEPVSEVPSKSRTPIISTEPESTNPDELQVEESGNGGAALPETPKKAHHHQGVSRGHGGRGLNPDIIVAFQHDSGPVDEVHVPGAGRLVRHVRGPNGREHTTVHLSELLPLAFEYASTPMKNRGGRLSRPGTTFGDSHVDIGSVAAFARKERVKYLESETANNYELEPVPDDGNTLVCRLFVRSERAPEVQRESQHSIGLTKASIPVASDSTVKPGPSSNIKGAQASDSVQAPLPGKSVDDTFVVWLRDKLNGPKREWKKGLSVADVLPRVKALRDALEHLRDWGWEKSQGGYQVPEGGGAGTYAGRSFKKDDILKALRLGSTTANSNDKLFAPAIMRKIPQLQEWYDNPDGPQAATFEHMTIRDFMKWRDDLLKPAKARKRNDKAKKRKYSSSEVDSSSADEREVTKKGKKKARRLSSEDLD
ncbi:hypothetical protein LXA43DRAFT_1105398 [Ganoderma leucocontextum]|nr:hypothetical protein LXA43DRAFT_1105398 [Ganoderma leucocontextum]